jgi:hypothetical protein
MITLVRRLTIALLSGIVALLFATAGNASGPTGSAFSVGDLHPIGAPRPPKSAGACTPTDPFLGKADLTLADLPSKFKPQKDFVNALRRAGFKRGYNKVWSCAVGDVVIFLYLVRDTAGARAVVGKMSGGCGAKRLAANGLGPPSFGCYTTQGSDKLAAYVWSRGNLVLFAETLCEGCDTAIAPVARSYAGLIDAAAARRR